MNLLTNSNRKIKKTGKLNGVRLYEFNLPAISSCPFADKCLAFCYANTGAFIWKPAREKYIFNMELTKSPVEFKELIQGEIDHKRVEFLRIHSSGDFYSMNYLKIWLSIAADNPAVVFYGYTKSVPLFKNIQALKNFIFCYSTGGKMDHLIQPEDKQAVIFDSIEELKAAGFTDCTVNDMAMIKTNKVGLVYH